MKKILLSLLLFVVAYSAFLLKGLPAAWVWNNLAQPMVGNQVQLAGIRGTIWEGQVQQVRIDRKSIENVSWSFQPSALFSGEWVYQVRLGGGQQGPVGRLMAGADFGGPFIRRARVSADMDWLLQFAPRAPLATPSGRVDLTLNEARQGQPWCEALDGDLSWTSAVLDTMVGELNLEQADARLSCDQGQPVASFASQSEVLEVNGEARLLANSYRVNGKVKAGPDAPQQLSQGMRYLGRPDSDQRYTINLEQGF